MAVTVASTTTTTTGTTSLLLLLLHLNVMTTYTNRVIVKPHNVALIACVEENRRTTAFPVTIKHQIPLTKRVLNSKAKVIQL